MRQRTPICVLHGVIGGSSGSNYRNGWLVKKKKNEAWMVNTK
jgi:hypothetical protein